MKICLTLKIIVCGLFCLLPVDLKGQACQCTYRNGGECSSCTVGCYLRPEGYCYKCRQSCHSCSQYRYCDVCKTGYYGPICDRDCNTCRNGSCTNSTCTDGCADGYYYYDNYGGGGYCRRCINECVTCIDTYDCTSCTAGRIGSYCQYCKDDYYISDLQCIQCNSNCILAKCDVNGGECKYGCQDGWSGWICNDACAPTCASCQRYRKSTCNSCPIGHYGTSCESECSSNCATNDAIRQCSIDNGDCNYGCVDGWTGSNCTEKCDMNCKSCSAQDKHICLTCGPRFYGQLCEKKCSSNCATKTGVRQCSDTNGDCNYGCVDGWTGSKCTEKCDMNCISCDAQDEHICLTCGPGFYGQSCENECNSNCATTDDVRQCSKTYGDCNSGCIDGWTGSKCIEKCDMNCISCDAQDKHICHICGPGFYGQSCENECSLNCVKAVELQQWCKSDGHCTDACVEGWTGSTCTEKCAAKCTSCDMQNGTACTSCKPGYYGPSCNIDCSEYCGNMTNASRQCQQDDGTCLDDCVTGYKGDECDVPCDAGCHSHCDRNTGVCKPCKTTYYGPSCQHLCNATCYDPGNGSNVCHQLSGECLFDRSRLLCSTNGETQDAQTSNNVAVIGGAVGSAVMIVLVVAVVFVFMFLRKRRRKMSDPEERVTYGNSVFIDDNNTDDNVYAVPDKKRSVNKNVDRTQSTAHSTLPKLTTSNGPVTIEDVIYGNIEGVPVIPSRLSFYEPEDNVEEIFEDEVISVDLKDADTSNAENYYNINGLTRSRVQVDTLRDYVASISTEAFEIECNKLPKGLTRPYGAAIKPTNVSKNRYQGIYPYNSTRVKLTGNGGDYINASYIQGFKESEKTYIASSGPTETFMKGYVEFWEMVWQEKVDKIVMLTNFMEESKIKCEKYWPDVGEHKTYGDINVHSMSDERYADFTVTKLTMKKNSHVSSIHHFHFTAWPDRGTPENVASLVEFRESVEHVSKITESPIVVHCSAGIGRTGTYIALDILTREGRRENYVDVYGCVLGLRGQRVFMVQNVQQYQFLHYAVSHSLTNKCEQIASKDFCTVNTDEMQEQFQLLGTVNMLNGNEEEKAIQKNEKEKYKNRKGACIPGDAHRPRLFKYNQNSKSDYINAIYVDGYKEKHRYIIAQTPLSRTVEDFLGLVLQENCSCIISLDPVVLKSKEDISDYLPDVNQELSVGKVNVSCVQRETTPEYILSKLNVCVQEVSTEEPKTILHYQYTEWPEESPVPSSARSFLNLVLESRCIVRDSNMQLEPVLIHCLAGGDRSGLFPVVANILEKTNSEQQASIVNVVSQVRARRPRAIPNKEQFKYCYELASLYVENNSVYSNIL